MQWYYIPAWLLIASQIFVVWLLYKNLKYTVSNPWKKRKAFTGKTLLTIPCKGIDLEFEENILSFYKQDYENFVINFVVESQADPAYKRLKEIKQKHRQICKAQKINILVAGKTDRCSQKIHNLLYSFKNSSDDIQALAFADSDACVHKTWLKEIVAPLNREKTGVATGYRWFVPKKNNPATIILSITNAKVAQFLGKYKFNQAWGGSMAITKQNFTQLKVPQTWSNIISDDLSLSSIVKKAGKKVVFVPTCFVASYEKTTIAKLYEFARRQFIITRIYMPLTWAFAIFSSLYTVIGFWGSLAVAIIAAENNLPHKWLYIAVPAVFILSHWAKAAFRIILIAKRLPSELKNLKISILTDLLLTPFFSILLMLAVLSSVYGRTITWRGIKYRLKSPKKTEVIA